MFGGHNILMNVAQFLKDYGELISITLIPFILWFLGKKFQDRKAKKDVKLSLFLRLMAHRGTVRQEYVDALNQIDVIFQDEPTVRSAWRAYYDSLHPKSQHFENSSSFLLDLLSEIAKVLNYKDLKQTEIARFYAPQDHEDHERLVGAINQELLRILKDSQNFGSPKV